MGILDHVHKFEKRLEKLAERSDIPMQPLEIRKAALDDVEDQVEASGRSRRVFPFNQVTVEVVAGHRRQRAALEAVLGEQGELKAAVAERLRAAGCAPPRDLDVQLKVVRRPGAEWQTGRLFRVVCEKRPSAGAARATGAGAAALVVLKGDAAHKSYGVKSERTNIGRLAEVLDRDKRVVRRNQVVFTALENGLNETVSRAHAHIQRMPDGEFRLFDDHSSCGTRVFRGGRTIALPSGSPRGTRLQAGDEIYVGQACLRFEIAEG